MVPRPNSSSGNDILPPCIFPVLLIGFSSLFFFSVLMCPFTQQRGEVDLGGEGLQAAGTHLGARNPAAGSSPACKEQPQHNFTTGEQNGENVALETRCTFSTLKAVA